MAMDARDMTLALLAERGTEKTICPSEVARALTKAGGAADAWRGTMPAVHDAVDRLNTEGLVQLSWKGKMLRARSGPYRIARGIAR